MPLSVAIYGPALLEPGDIPGRRIAAATAGATPRDFQLPDSVAIDVAEALLKSQGSAAPDGPRPTDKFARGSPPAFGPRPYPSGERTVQARRRRPS